MFRFLKSFQIFEKFSVNTDNSDNTLLIAGLPGFIHQRAGGRTHLPASPLVGPRAAFTAGWCRESLRELCLEILSPCQAQFIAYFDICKIDSSVIKRAKILLWIIYNLHLFHSDSSTATLDDLPQIFNQSPAWSFSIGGGTIIQRGGFLLVHQQLVELDEPLQ